MVPEDLTALQLDALCEIGGIGAAHAATMLSDLVGEPVTLTVPRVEIVDFADVASLFGGPESLVLAVYSRISGDLGGGVLLMADAGAALDLVVLSRGAGPGSSATVGREAGARFRHLASMLIAPFIAAVSRLTGLDVLPMGQSHGYDMAGALLEVVAVEFGKVADETLIVHADFVGPDGDPVMALFFVPDPDGLPVLFERLGIA